MFRHWRYRVLSAPLARTLVLPLLLFALLGPASPASAAPVAQQPASAALNKPWRSLDDGTSKHALLSDRASAAVTVTTRRKAAKPAASLAAASAGLVRLPSAQSGAPELFHRLTLDAAPVLPGRSPRPYDPQGPPTPRA